MIKIEHRIGVPTNSRAIWDVLSDLGRWSEWNTVYPEVHGLLRIAQKLAITEVFPHAPPTTITPTIVDWVPNEQILWQIRAPLGMVKRLRYIEIEKLSEEGCIFSNGEFFSGMLSPLVVNMMRRPIKNGFAALGEAMKLRAEAAYAKVPRAEKAKAKKRAQALAITVDKLKPVKPTEPLKPMVPFGKTGAKLKSS